MVQTQTRVVFVKKSKYYTQYFCCKSANLYNKLYCNVEIHPRYKKEYYLHIKHANWLVKILRTGRGRWVLRLQLSLSVSCSTSPGTSLCNARVEGCFLQLQEFYHRFFYLSMFSIFFPVFHFFLFLDVNFHLSLFPLCSFRFLDHLSYSSALSILVDLFQIQKYTKDSKFRKWTEQ